MGQVPAGLPPLTVRWWLPPEERLTDLIWVAATLALVGLMESIAIAKSLAAAAHQDVDPNQELIGGQHDRTWQGKDFISRAAAGKRSWSPAVRS